MVYIIVMGSGWGRPHLPEELLQKGGGPAVVQLPLLGRMADVRCMQQEG